MIPDFTEPGPINYDAEVQEALSRKYMAPMILPLDSGRYALLGVDRQLINIGTWDQIQFWLETYEPPAEVRHQPKTKKLTITLSLEDLGF